MSADLARRVHDAALARTDDAAPSAVEVEHLVAEVAPLLSGPDRRSLRAEVLARIHGLGPLDPLLGDPTVSDVLVNGPGPVWVERSGRLERSEVVLDREAIDLLVERIVAPLGLRADRRTPLVDARLPDGSRVHVALPPLAVDGPYISVRRFGAATVPLDTFGEADRITVLRRAVAERRNIVICGGTGAGKTTLLNAIGQELPAGERIVTIEDTAELRLPGDHVVRLEGRAPTADGFGAVTIRQLVRTALRMRPDRLVVGEVRGAEALDMVQALSTGHAGSLSTCHAADGAETLRRLETLVLTAGAELPLSAVRDHVRAAVDLVVGVGRVPGRPERRITGLWEVGPPGDAEPLRPLPRPGGPGLTRPPRYQP